MLVEQTLICYEIPEIINRVGLILEDTVIPKLLMTPKPQHDIIEEFESISDNLSRGEATP